jgi:hypothetical protein
VIDGGVKVVEVALVVAGALTANQNVVTHIMFEGIAQVMARDPCLETTAICLGDAGRGSC